MSVKFTPDGFLDIASDPSQLPQESDGKNETSGAMRRCTNLHLDAAGVASTRKGSVRDENVLPETNPLQFAEQDSGRYIWSGDQLFQDFTSLATGLAPFKPYWMKGAAYNAAQDNIFWLNGSDRKRLAEGVVYEWGIDQPGDAPRLYAIPGKVGDLTGTFYLVHTFAREIDGAVVCESNPVEASIATALTAQWLMTVVEGPLDKQVTHIRTYRTTAGGSTYYHDIDATLPIYSDYSYCYDWEESYGYLSGTGNCLTSEGLSNAMAAISDCDALVDDIGTWSVETGDAGISIETYSTFKVEGYGSLKVTMGSEWSTIKLALNKALNLTGANRIVFYFKGPSGTGYWPRSIYVYMGEATYAEQVKMLTVTTGVWSELTWNIANIASGDKDAITELALYLPPIPGKSYYIDYFIYDAAQTKKIFSWEPYQSDSAYDQYYSMGTYQWEPVIITSNTLDTALGTEVLRTHDRPQAGSFCFGPSLNGSYFILYQNKMYYSLEKQPEHWPLTYYLEVSSTQFPLKSGCLFDGTVYVASETEIYQIQGSGHESWFPFGMSALCGTVSPSVFLPVHGMGIFHLGNDGLYLYSGNGDQNITNERFRPIFQGTTVEDVPGINKTYISNCWALVFKNKLYFGYPKSGSTYPDSIMVTDLKTGKHSLYDYGQTFPVVGIDHYYDRILALDTSGYIWHIEHADYTTDHGTAISWSIQSKDYSDQLRKYFPRWARYDITLGSGATATGAILLNGESKQTHTLSTSRKTKKRLITGCTGDRVAIRITGTGPVDFYACEIE